jgi:hypothetical protein
VALIFANAAWGCFCVLFALTLIENSSILAIAHFVFEGIYVGGLAIVEWSWRRTLQIAD